MYEVNRSVFLLIPLDPFWNWLQSLSIDLSEYSLEDLQADANAYLVNSHPGCRHDCIFLICDSCGEAKHIDDDALTGSLVSAARAAGFADIRPVVELRGICGRCN